MDKRISLDLANEHYYLIVPANGHQSLFCSVFAYDALIKQLNSISDVSLLGYCLFQDSIHLLIHSATKPSQWIDPWLMEYNQWHQSVTGDSGYLFHDDQKRIILIQPRYLPRTLKYLHSLPVAKKLCNNIDQYLYSSYNGYLETNRHDLNTQKVLSILSPHNGQRIRRYIDYMHGKATEFSQGIESELHDYYEAYADHAYLTRMLSNYGQTDTKKEEFLELEKWQNCLQAMQQATQLDAQTLLGVRRHSILPDAHFILAWLYVNVAHGPLYLAAKQLGLDEMTLKLNINSVQLHHPEAYLRYISQSWRATPSVA